MYFLFLTQGRLQKRVAGLLEAHDGTVTVLRGGSQGPGDQVMQRQSQDRILEINQEGLRDPSCCVGGWVWERNILEDLNCSYGHWGLTDHKCVLGFPSPLLSPDNNLKTKAHRGKPSGRVEEQLCTRKAVVAFAAGLTMIYMCS